MNRKTLVAGLVFAGLVVVTIGLLRSPEKGDRSAAVIARPLAKLKAGDFDTLEVTRAGAATAIKKQGEAYRMVKPVDYAADKDAARMAFDALEKLEFATILSDQKSRHGEFEVGDGSLRVVAKRGDKVVADLRLGKSAGDQTMVRIEGKDEVWAVTGVPRYQFDKDATAWRDKTMVNFDEKDAEKIAIACKTGGKIVLHKPAAADGGAPPDWRVTESAVKVEPFDKSVASGLISQMSSWKANDFADGAKLEETGLDSPQTEVSVTLKGGRQIKVLIGKKKGDEDTYVKLADNPQVFLVKKWNLDRVNKRPIEFRDKTMCNLTPEELTEIAVNRDKEPFTLVKSGTEWKLSRPAGATPDPSKIAGITGAFSDWKAHGFAEDVSPKSTGLAKPSAVIAAKSNVKGHACSLKIGGETADKSSYHVAAAGQPDVFVVNKWSIDRVLTKLDDLKKK